MAKPGLSGRWLAITRLVRQQVQQGAPCWICQLPIDLRPPTEGGPEPRSRWAFSVDHVTPRSRGGQSTLANARPAHYGCNSRRGNGTSSSQRTTWRPRRW
jgi:5-methylcytosine-specific restriction endonuclease McrA